MKRLFLFYFLITCATLAFGNNSNILNGDDPALLAKAKGFMQNISSGFEENKGQVKGIDASKVKFASQIGDLSVFLLNDAIVYQFKKNVYPEGFAAINPFASQEENEKYEDLLKKVKVETHRMDLQLVGANQNPIITTEGKSGDFIQYYNENSLNVFSYSKITYHAIYPNIDWVIYNKNGQIKYDFIIHPGGDPNQIKLKASDVEMLKLNENGKLELGNSLGGITEDKPVSFQNNKEIPTHFILSGNVISFKVESYNPNEKLIIDPVVRIWGTYYGSTSSSNTHAYSTATDASGNVYIAGETNTQFLIATGGHQVNYGGGARDAFLYKFSSCGVRLWTTYYGGTVNEVGRACAVDASGNVYLAGYTNSTAGIAAGGHQNTFGGGTWWDAFLVKFNASGVRQWGTYYGGSSWDYGYACAVDGSGSVILAGYTNSPNVSGNIAFGSHQNVLGGNDDGFLVKFNTNGVRSWSAYYGGVSNDMIKGCKADASGNIYIVGETGSTTSIATVGSHQEVSGGNFDAFLAKFNSTGIRQWGTYYGGVNADRGYACALDASANVYIAGETYSPASIALNGHQNTYSTGQDAFLVKFSTGGVREWGTYYGDTGNDVPWTCSTNSTGDVFLIGQTTSTINIASVDGYQTAYGGATDAFLVKLNSTGARLWGTYYGGTGNDVGYGCAADNSGNIFISGETNSTTDIAYSGYQNNVLAAPGYYDAFLVKLNETCGVTVTPSVLISASSSVICAGSSATFTATPTNGGGTPTYQWKKNGVNVGTNSSTFTTSTINNGDVFTVEMTTSELCASPCGPVTSSNSVTMTVNSVPTTPTAPWPQAFCNSGTVAQLIATGSNIQWYSVGVGGSPLLSTTPLSAGTYYVTQTVNGCESFRLSVVVNISIPAAPTGSAAQTLCTTATVSEIAATGSGIQWYSVASGGTPLAGSTSLISGTTYYATQTVGSCESTGRLAVTVTLSQSLCNSLHFDGTNDRVDLPATTHSTIGTAGTLEAWIKTSNAGTSFRGIIVREFRYGLFLNNNQLMSYNWTASGSTGATTYTGATLNDNQWHHVVLTFQSGVANGSRLYVDGVAVGTAFTHFNGTNTPNFTIGNNGTSTQVFQGQIDDVKIWSRVLTPAEISATFNCGSVIPTNLAAKYNFNQGVNSANNAGITTLIDGSGANNNGTLVNFGLNGATTNWITGLDCAALACPTPTGSASQTFCNSATVANLVATGTAIQWYAAATGGTALASGTALVNGTTYYATQTTGVCESSSRLAVTVTINSTSAPTGTAAQTFCNSATVANLVATGTAIQWYTAATGGSALASGTALVNGTTYYASQTIAGCESASRFAVTVTINTPTAPTGTAAQSFCNSATVANLVATGTAIQWYASSTGGSALTAGTTLVNGTTYYASQTITGCESATRFAVTVTINAPAAPTGIAAQTICNSATVSNLTATGTGVQWYTASTGGSALTAGTALATGTTYYATQTISGCESVNRFVVTVTINAPAAPTGTAAQTFCNSATVANLTATGTAIQWYAASTGGSALATGTALTNGTTYYATQTISGCQSATRFAVTVSINAPAAPTGTAAQTFCNSATVANLTATGTGVQWYAASTGGTALTTGTALATGTTYYASQTISGCESATRFAVTVSINAPAAPTGTSAQTFCNSATVANLTATGTGIQWYAASTGGAALTTGTALATGTTYYASQTISGCESATRFAVTVSINTPATPTGSASQTFCNSATVTNLTATGIGVQWYAASTGGTVLTTGTALATGTMYYATQTISGCESATRFAVAVTVNVTSSPTGSSTQTVCSGAIVGDLSASGTNIQWYSTASGGSPLSPSTALVNGVTYYASQTINSCESATRLGVTVAFGIPSAPTGSASQSICNSGTVANLVASGSNIQWYTAATGGSPLSAGTTLVNGTTYYASQTSGGCESTNRLAVSVTINAPAAPTGTAAQIFCNSATVANLTATGTGIQWYAASTGGTALTTGTVLATGTTYYASQTITGCESANRLAISVTINTPSAPTGATSQTICGAGTLADLTISGTGITWYDAATAGNVLTPATALVNGVTYFATQTISGCESLNQLAVTASINAIPAAPSGTATQDFCNSATIADLGVTGTSITWYASALSTTPLNSTFTLSDGVSYFATQTVNGCESTDRLEVTVAINAPATPTGNTTQAFCSAAIVDDLNATGTSITWYTTVTGGAALVGSATLSNGTYYASQTINGCESANRLAVAVTVTIIDATVTQSGITLTTNQAGANYTWIDCNNSNQPIVGANAQSYTATANGSYAVEIDLNGCSAVSTCYVINSVGLEEDKLEILNVQPNPTSGNLNISTSKATSVVITSANGATLATFEIKGNITIDVSSYARGMYFIRTAEGQTLKFIKQ